MENISTGDLSEALAALLGKDAPGPWPTAIARQRTAGLESTSWQKRDHSEYPEVSRAQPRPGIHV
jgi:hypothetical protein